MGHVLSERLYLCRPPTVYHKVAFNIQTLCAVPPCHHSQKCWRIGLSKSKLFKVNLKKNICFRWRKGRCRKEKSCPYMHREESGTYSKKNWRSPKERARDSDRNELATELPPQKAAERCGIKPGVSVKWSRGECSRGDVCRFRH